MTEIIENLAISTRTTWTYGGTQLKNLIFKSGRKNGGAVEEVLEYGLTGGSALHHPQLAPSSTIYIQTWSVDNILMSIYNRFVLNLSTY